MKPSEIFNILADKVSEVCEVRKEEIINGSKVQSVVNARVLLVQYLRRVGLSNDDIARIVLTILNKDKDGYYPSDDDVKRKAKGVDKMFSCYSQHCLESYAFCLMSKEIKEFCHETYKDLYIYGMKELPTK